MAEEDVVKASPRIGTRGTLASDLRALGVRPGGVVLVHSSLRALGWIAGGALAVLQALEDAISPCGTLVMPSQSQDLTDPAGWEAPAVPADWHDTLRNEMPAFDRHLTPTRDMGRIAELFRTWPHVLRSDHPTSSFTACGPAAEEIVREQPLTDPFGDRSPLARLHALDARILLLGVSFERCTALHLAERRAWPAQKTVWEASPMMVDGERRWIRYALPVLRQDLLEAAGLYLMRAGLVRTGRVGMAMSHLVPCRALVDAAAAWWRSHEPPLDPKDG